jgi:hypothetical protein
MKVADCRQAVAQTGLGVLVARAVLGGFAADTLAETAQCERTFVRGERPGRLHCRLGERGLPLQDWSDACSGR